MLVLASEGESLAGFVVPRDAAGLRATPESYIGIRALPTVELALDGVRVPADARLGGADGGRTCARWSRAAASGSRRSRSASRARPSSWRATTQRSVRRSARRSRPSRRSPSSSPTWRSRSTARACWSGKRPGGSTSGADATREATLAIQQVRRVALEVADGAVQVFGGHGYIREYLPEMLLRNARGFACFEALTLV